MRQTFIFHFSCRLCPTFLTANLTAFFTTFGTTLFTSFGTALFTSFGTAFFTSFGTAFQTSHLKTFCTTFQSCCIECIALDSKSIQVALICQLVCTAHLHVLQLFPGLSQTRGGSVVLDAAILQIVEPLLYRSRSHIIKLIHTDEEILREHLFRSLHLNDIILLDVHL